MEGFVKEDNLIVISDFHLGNPAFQKNEKVIEFFEFILKQDANLCINGDGVDFLQPSVGIFASYLPMVAKQVISMISAGKRVYYVIGNHDLFLEHFLYSWGTLEIVPFLNVISGNCRIHIEHAHIYDTMYAQHPNLYLWAGKMAGRVMNFWPGFFRLVYRIEDLMSFLSKLRKKVQSASNDVMAAENLLNRGFDVVIFGHTHRIQDMKINGKVYMNLGAWEKNVMYIHIVNGDVKMIEWA